MQAEHISTEMRRHAPFTFAGTATGIVIMAGFMLGHVPQRVSATRFWTCHIILPLLHAQPEEAVRSAELRTSAGSRHHG